MRDFERWLTAIVVILILAARLGAASAPDLGQWANEDPEIRHWYQRLMQPDSPAVSCCGEADAYWCDDVFTKEVEGVARNFCRITDDRPDEPRGRPHRPLGETYEIPPHKFNDGKNGNPTGHSVLFLNVYGVVFCFIMNTGI